MFHNRSALVAASRRPYVAAGGGGWTPASVSTDLWYDADDAATITASGGLVTQWRDKSGNNRHATQSGTLRLTDTASVQNGKHGLLSVVANQTYMDIPAFTRAQPFIVVCAFKRTTATANYEGAWEANNTGAGTRPAMLTRFNDGTSDAGIYDGTNFVKGGGALANNTPYYFVGVFDGASSKFRKNGAAIATGTMGSGGITAATSQQLANYYLPMPGYLLEFFIIPGNSTTDITNAESYLAAKWAI